MEISIVQAIAIALWTGFCLAGMLLGIYTNRCLVMATGVGIILGRPDLGLAMGACPETFAGLTGVGDLIVTCTSMHSRNRRAGILIGQGKTAKEAMDEVGAVVEGYYAAESAWGLCQKMGVEMPILQAAYNVLYNDAPARNAVGVLMGREQKSENEISTWQVN